MKALLSGLKKILNPVVDALHLRGAARTVYQYLTDNPFMLWVILAFAVLFITAFILIIVLSVKARKRSKAIKYVEEHPQVDTPLEQEQAENVASAEEIVEETTEIVAEEPAPVEEVKAEEMKAEEPAPVEKAKKAPAKKKATTAKAVAPVVEPVAKPVATPAPVEKPAEKTAKYRGKWVLTKMVTQQENSEETEEMYFFELRASNGEKLLESQEYTSLAGAKKGIETHLNNIKNGNFKVSLTKKGTYIFKLMNAKGMLLCTGENYPQRTRCESAIESTKRFAETAVIDEKVQEIIVKVPAEDEAGTPAPVSQGTIGKWIISKQTDETGDVAYYFELFANNGEKLLSSEDYTSQNGALNGLETHKKNIEQGNFRIVPTKRGDYIFKLLNGNNQLLCLGAHYKTRRMCQSAVESVKRFALNSPIVSDEE